MVPVKGVNIAHVGTTIKKPRSLSDLLCCVQPAIMMKKKCKTSGTTTKPERKYCVIRKELLAILKSIAHFHRYLYGQELLIQELTMLPYRGYYD